MKGEPGEVDAELVKNLRGGISYPVARELAVRKYYGDKVADEIGRASCRERVSSPV